MRHGYVEADDGDDEWDLSWSDLSVTVDKVAAMKPYQRLNHFPSMLEICRKVSLSKHMSRMAARLPSEFNFYPLSFQLPKQLDELLVALRRNTAKVAQGDSDVQTFILKPSSGAQGRGIHLVQNVAQLQGIDVTDCVAQRYVNKPLLIDGLKFDLRIYCLVLSVDPLKIYLYDEGLARLATTLYAAPSSSNLDTATIHLTNYAINKSSASFVSSGEGGPVDEERGGGTKRLASSVLSSIAQKRGVSYNKLVDDISSIVVKSVMAIQPVLAHTYHTAVAACTCRESTLQSSSCPCLALDHAAPEGCSCSCPPSQCFEVLGFDIMFDESLKPWLLEVNHSPSFSCDEQIDHKIKSSLISDTLTALAQKTKTREKFVDAQLQALSSRLYSNLSPSTSFRRPQSGFKQRSPSFASEQNLDDLLNNTPSFSGLSFSRPSSAVKPPTSASSSSWGRSSVLNQDPASQLASSRSLGGPGFIIGPYNASTSEPADGSFFTCFSASASVGLWGQIFPSESNDAALVKTLRTRHLAILQAASDNFNDQRCSCSWCSKRMRRRYMSSGLSALARCDSSRLSDPSPHPSPRQSTTNSNELRSLSGVEREYSSPQQDGESCHPHGLPPRTHSRSSSPSIGGGKSRFESCLGGSRPSSSRMANISGAEYARETGNGPQGYGRSALVKSASENPLPSTGSAFLALTERRMASLKLKTSYLLSDRSDPSTAPSSSAGARKGGLGSAIRRRG